MPVLFTQTILMSLLPTENVRILRNSRTLNQKTRKNQEPNGSSPLYCAFWQEPAHKRISKPQRSGSVTDNGAFGALAQTYNNCK